MALATKRSNIKPIGLAVALVMVFIGGVAAVGAYHLASAWDFARGYGLPDGLSGFVTAWIAFAMAFVLGAVLFYTARRLSVPLFVLSTHSLSPWGLAVLSLRNLVSLRFTPSFLNLFAFLGFTILPPATFAPTLFAVWGRRFIIEILNGLRVILFTTWLATRFSFHHTGDYTTR